MKNLFLALIAFIFVISCSSSDDTYTNCSKPLNASLSSVDENFAYFSYSKEGVLSISVIEYGEPGFELGVNTIGTSEYSSHSVDIGLGIKSHLLYGLEPSKSYEAYIKLQCVGELSYSEYSGPISFSTLAFGEGCTQPVSLLAMEVTDTTILIDWEGYTNENWEVQLVENFDDGFNDIYKYQATEKPYLIENLSPGTTYVIEVRANLCHEYEINGAPSNEITVVTSG